MKVVLEDAGVCRKIMRVHVPSDMVAPEYDKVLKEYARKAKIPGFRQGRAPADVVERRYAKGISEDAKDRLLPRCYEDALQQEKIDPVAVIDVQDVVLEKELGLTFHVTIDIAPNFKLPRYRKIRLRRNRDISVGDTEIDQTITRIRESFGRYEDVTGRAVKGGDLVRIDYNGICGGVPVKELVGDRVELGDGRDFLAMVGEPEFLPGLAKGMEGAEIGVEKNLEIHFPADYNISALAGKDATYSVTVKGIRERILPELDGELLGKLEVASIEALRGRIREDLLKAAEEEEKERLKGEIIKHLLAKTSFEPPRSLVERETRLAARNIVERIGMQGASKEQIEERREDILNAASSSSVDRVRISYILGRIAEEEELGVGEQEMAQRIELMAKRNSMSPERLKTEMEKRDSMESLKKDLLAEKTMDFLLEHAKVK
jgi:trigger factor